MLSNINVLLIKTYEQNIIVNEKAAIITNLNEQLYIGIHLISYKNVLTYVEDRFVEDQNSND